MYIDLATKLRERADSCGQCGGDFKQDDQGRMMIYCDAICPGGRFCSKECLDDRLAGK